MNTKKVMLYLCYITFGFVGFILSMRTNIFLFVQRDYLDGYNHIATLVLVSGICMQITLFFAGQLIEKYGYNKMLLAGILGFTAPVLMMIFVESALSFDISFIFLMFGYGVLVLVLNLFVSNLEPDRKGNVLLMLHLFFAIGALLGPKCISYFVDSGISWQSVIAVSSLPLFLISIFIIKINKSISLIQTHGTVAAEIPEKHIQKSKSTFAGYNNPLVWLFIIVFMCSQTWEYGVGTWFIIFASETKKLSSSESAFYLTLFYGSYPLVRILFSRIIHHLNLLIVLLFSFLGCGLFIFLGIVTGNLIFYSLTGLCVALMYPAMLASMQNIFGIQSTKIIGFITMSGGLIQYIAIWGVGLISEQWGIHIGFTSMLVYMLIGSLSLVCIILLERKSHSNRILV